MKTRCTGILLLLVSVLLSSYLNAQSYQLIPARIEAENWFQMNGVQSEACSDDGGGLNVGWIDNGDWMNYPIRVATAGTYQLKLRLASGVSGGQLQAKIGSSVIAAITVTGTGGWQNWLTYSAIVTLPAGNHLLSIHSTATPSWNFNWLELTNYTNNAPQAFAGADQTITLPANSVVLNGSGADSDGTVSSYSWSLVSGPATYVLATPAQPSTAVTGLVQGTYTFQLTVTDNLGSLARDTAIVKVNAPGNAAPVVRAGRDTILFFPANAVTITGSATDADGSIAGYQWTKISGPAQYTIASPTQPQTAFTNLVRGIYIFRLTATDNLGLSNAADVRIDVRDCGGARRVIIPWSDGGRFFSGRPTNPNYLPVNPGDTLVLRASYNTWSYFALEDIHGTRACPLVVINEGGQVSMTKGIDLKHSSNIKVTGSGSNDTYGFKVSSEDPIGSNGVAIAITGRCRFIEVEKVFVTKKTYGSWIKEDGSCIDSLNYPNWKLDNVKIHDCKFRNIGQSAIYAGNTSPTGTRPVYCNGVTTYPVPMRLSNIQLYNLIVDSCFRSGIQLGGADSGYNAIYNNIVTRTGYELNQQQGTGISIGGMTRNCHVYNNFIRSTFLYGIFSVGVGDNFIENNTIDSSGYLDGIPNTQSLANGIYVDTRQTLPFDSSRTFVLNNRFGVSVSPHEHDIFFDKTINSYAVGSRICGNTKLDGVTPAQYYAVAGVPFYTCGNPPAGNRPPIANAGYNQVFILPQNSGNLRGSAMDPDGTIASVQWTKISGPAAHVIIPPNQPYTYVGSLVEGTYRFEMRVTDNAGAVSIDTTTIIVQSTRVNLPPTANAGADQNIMLPVNQVQLQGLGSDVDGTISSYRWTKIAGPAGAAIANPDAAGTVVNGLVQGTYLFELTVRDNEGALAKDTMRVVVGSGSLPLPNTAPAVNAGSDQTIQLPASTASLQGSAVDADGTITSYQWTQVAGPATATLTNPAAANTTAANLQQGTYQFELSVTDNIGAVSRDTVSVNVIPVSSVNTPPVSQAGPDQVITLPANTATLQGSGSDVDGQITSYQWTMVSGPSPATISSPSTAVTGVSGLVQGVYTFSLLVTDNNGATARDSVRITVTTAGNQAPLANAGADQTIQLPANSVTLTGSASDADGSIASYQWTKIAGPAAHTIASPSTAQTSVTNLVEGTYSFELAVTDNLGAIGRDTVNIIVRPAATPTTNTPPVANAGRDLDIRLPNNSVNLQGSGTDVDGTIVSYQWTAASGPAGYTIVSPAQPSTQVRNLVQGTYQFVLKVTDNNGATATDTVQVQVKPANKKPTATTVNRVSVQLPVAMAMLQGSASDEDGYITSYRWSKISGPSTGRIMHAGNSQTAVNQLSEGQYVFELKVTDNEGEEARDTVWMTVLPMNQLPVVSAGPDRHISLPASRVELNGSARDNDGNITRLQWNRIRGEVCNISSANTATTSVSGLIEGTYLFELVATDNKGGVGRDTVEIRVDDPTSGLGNGTVFPNPATTQLHLLINTETQRNVTTIHVVDLAGRVVMTDSFMRNTHRVMRSLDVSRLKTGMYLIYVDWEINKKLATKFIKQ